MMREKEREKKKERERERESAQRVEVLVSVFFCLFGCLVGCFEILKNLVFFEVLNSRCGPRVSTRVANYRKISKSRNRIVGRK